jgi:hypothetical protein
MTPLQIIRNALIDGLTLQLSQQADGYHVTVTGADGRRIEIVDTRLDQAIQRARR